MYIRYDALDRNEPLIMTLCNPGSQYNEMNHAPTKSIGILIDTTDEEMVLNFNQVSELNFRVSRIHRDDDLEDRHSYNLYKSIQPRRLIYVTDVGYFVIKDVSDGYNDGTGTFYKDIKAQSAESELANKKVPFIENGTYRFSDSIENNEVGLFDAVASTIPLWTIGEVDEVVAARYRTFEDVDINTNVLSFFIENMQEAYECIFLFDIKNRIINVFDQSSYALRDDIQTDIYLSKDDVIKSLEITENTDNLYTALSVVGNDNISIGAVNPLGGNVIYNFSNYLSWMSDGLRERVLAWQENIQRQSAAYLDLNEEYYAKLKDATDIDLEMQRLDNLIAIYVRCRDNIVAESSVEIADTYNSIIESERDKISIQESIDATLSELKRLIDLNRGLYEEQRLAMSKINTDITDLRTSIENICNSLAMSNPDVFSPEEYEELCNYIFEGSYSDEYVVITDTMSYSEMFEQINTMYNRAVSTLDKASMPSQEIKIDVENFIFTKKFAHWTQQLKTGCFINVSFEENELVKLFLLNITVNYEDHTLKMTFGTHFQKYDVQSLFNEMLGDISKSTNSINFIKDTIHPIKTGELNNVKRALQNSRNLSMNDAITSHNEEVIIDATGYTGRSVLPGGEYDPRQIKIIGKSIVFTDDAWETCKVAIGEMVFGENTVAYGINAENIIGDLIVGRNLRIVGTDGRDKFAVLDDKIKSEIGSVNDRMSSVEQTCEDFVIQFQDVNDRINSGVNNVRTTNGYKFDAEGLTIFEEGNAIKNTLDNNGMRVTRSDEDVLVANSDGVKAMNLHSRQFLIIGSNCRFEDYYDTTGAKKRTACFYTGR